VLEDQKDAKRKKKMPSDEEWKKRADDAIIENDETWVDQATQQRKADLDKLGSKGYWDRLTVHEDGFHEEFKQVLPYALKDTMAGQTKTSLLPIIKDHLDLVFSIANKEQPNTISNTDVSHLAHDNTLELFVDIDSSPYLKLKKEKRMQRHKATAVLMKLGGPSIAEKYKDMGPK